MNLRWTARGAVVLVIAGTLATGVPLALDAAPAFAACAPTPNTNATPLSGVPWQLTRLRPESAWPLSRGKNQIVAVIDDGVSSKHPELAGQVLSGTDLLDAGGKGDCDNDGHGTFVASLIAGKDSPNTAFHGIAPDAKILPIRVLNDMSGTTDTDAPKRVADGINYAVDHNATIINLSLYTPKSSDVEDAVKNAIAKGVVVVAAAGNTGSAGTVYPAALPGVIAVAGVDVNGNRVSSSTTGPYVAIAAPGDANVAGAARDGTGYLRDDKGGTSFAAALVSGTAALVRARFPNLTPAQVARRLTATADAPPGGRNDEVGAGVVNPYRAVATILANQDTVLPSPRAHLAETSSRTIDNAHTRTIALVTAALGLVAAFVMIVVVPLVRGLARTAADTGGRRAPRSATASSSGPGLGPASRAPQPGGPYPPGPPFPPAPARGPVPGGPYPGPPGGPGPAGSGGFGPDSPGGTGGPYPPGPPFPPAGPFPPGAPHSAGPPPGAPQYGPPGAPQYGPPGVPPQPGPPAEPPAPPNKRRGRRRRGG